VFLCKTSWRLDGQSSDFDVKKRFHKTSHWILTFVVSPQECQGTISKKSGYVNRLFGINPNKVILLDEKTKVSRSLLFPQSRMELIWCYIREYIAFCCCAASCPHRNYSNVWRNSCGKQTPGPNKKKWKCENVLSNLFFHSKICCSHWKRLKKIEKVMAIF
jgi:hypothetical protein